MSNKAALLEQMDLFAARFDTLRNALANNDEETMRAMMRTSTERRREFDKESIR